MKVGKMKSRLAVLLGCMCAVTSIFSSTRTVYATETSTAVDTIVVDGDISEWAGMSSLEVADGSVSEWKATTSEDGSVLFLCFTGTAVTEWDSTYMWDVISITYADGTSDNIQFATLAGAWGIPGAKVAAHSTASGTSSGIYSLECVIPMTEGGYSITFAGTTISEADIPEFVAPIEDTTEPVYTGIVIDGKYNDWAAVTRMSIECPEESGHGYDCLNSAACIFDGEYVYVYLKDGESGNASGAGTNSNGKYAITTDTGRVLLFQLSTKEGASVSGVDGAEVAYFGGEWEVAIPADKLPLYQESIAFGLYLEEPFISDIMDLQGGEGTAGELGEIVYDGLYGDWNAYPHTLIHYAGSGTQESVADAEGAVYLENNEVLGHIKTLMPVHLKQRGGEFTEAISICFNGDRAYYEHGEWNLYPRIVTIAADGAINWEPVRKDLPNGTYEFYMLDTRGEYNILEQTNISDLAEYEKPYGKMIITITDGCDEMEFQIDLEQAAEFMSHNSGFNISPSEFKTVEAQFSRVGNDFLTIAGTSSGPLLGVGLCISAVGLVLLKRRRNKAVK